MSRHVQHMQRLDTFLKPLFWIALVFAYACAIMPAVDAPKFANSDKVEHIVTFITLSALAMIAWRGARWWSVFVPMAIFGAVIEFTQMIPILHRDAELNDWFADMGGAAVGIAIGYGVRMVLRRLVRERPAE
jgi:VanZ family protein